MVGRSHITGLETSSGGWRRLAVIVSIMLLCAGQSAAAVHWLPGETAYPRILADYHEPNTSMAYGWESNRFDTSVGAPFPLAATTVLGQDVTTVIEGAAFFKMQALGKHFSVANFDGLAGVGFEMRGRNLAARLRLLHFSSHSADGDTANLRNAHLFTREYWQLEGGPRWRTLFVRAGLGTVWNSVPHDGGLHLFLGGQWTAPHGSWRPFGALNLDTDRARSWRVNQTYLAGLETGGECRIRLGLRYYNGNSPYGQYWSTGDSYWSAVVQYSRGAG
jgi:hypothetical protein